MRVFVTGATGYVGRAVVRELREADHEVLGLARDDQGAEALARQSVEPHRGDLEDEESLAAGARACDGVIHLAFIHDFSRYGSAGEVDRRVVEAMAGALEGTGKPLVLTSGTLVLAPGRLVVETDAPALGGVAASRAPSEAAVMAASARGVRGSVVRLPPLVHGKGDHGFVPALIDAARKTGSSAFVGNGANRWPAVHRLDAARLFRLAVEGAPPGTPRPRRASPCARSPRRSAKAWALPSEASARTRRPSAWGGSQPLRRPTTRPPAPSPVRP